MNSFKMVFVKNRYDEYDPCERCEDWNCGGCIYKN